MRFCSLAIVCSLLLVAGCGKKKIKIAKPAKIGSAETGIASWYGHPYHGRRAANGEVYDMERLTAAHRTLPFETWVRVKNVSNDKTVDVRIQDRGPFVGGRIIDLSKAAARDIEMIGPGITKVRVTVIAPPPMREVRRAEVAKAQPKDAVRDVPNEIPRDVTSDAAPQAPVASVPEVALEKRVELFAVQVGAFRELTNAESVRDQMRVLYGKTELRQRDGNPPVWRVLVGEEPTLAEAEALAERIRSSGTQALAVRLDPPAQP